MDDPNDPKNWTPLHCQVEAYNKIRELITGPKQRIPEALVRRTLADQYGCKPEEVTPKQINLEVAGLLRYYPAIELIPMEALPDSTLESEGIASEIDRRAKLLGEYKEATGKPSNRKIYTAKRSGIYKPEFYKWVNGTLSSTSETAKNFERFLREKKPPT